MLEILTAKKPPVAPAEYMLSKLRAVGNLAYTNPVNVDPGATWNHNDLGSIYFNGGKITVGGASSSMLPPYVITAGKDFTISFSVYPTDQNESVILGDLINYEGAMSWTVILNRKSGNISSVEIVVNDSTTNSVRVFSFYLGTKLPVNAWSDIVIKRVSGSMTCTINGTLRGTHAWNNGVKKTGIGMFTIGRSADITQPGETYTEPFRGYLNNLIIDIKQ